MRTKGGVTGNAAAQRRRAADAPVSAVIDIGSNSIRLVAFRGQTRTPLVLFNEKVMAGLGRGVAETGAISDEGMETARAALMRFKLLTDDMRVDRLHAFATAAVRDAGNRDAFVDMARRQCGLDVRVLSGAEEAKLAAYGVIAGIPGADGVVGDLGGGSLELVRVRNGKPRKHLSLPIGALRLDAARKAGPRRTQRLITAALAEVDWAKEGKGLPFYMVGGSWRALAQVHMHLTDYPLPVVHQYAMDAAATDRLARALPNLSPKRLKSVPYISSARIPQLPGAALLLRAAVRKLGSSGVVASSYGIREGVLYVDLPQALKEQDPLVAAAIEEGRGEGRFPLHADALMAWMNGLFAPEPAAETRLRQVAAILSDTAWRAHPDFRAERALELAIHGNWVGINGRERTMLGTALFAVYGGPATDPAIERLTRLAGRDELARAYAWGLALRLGQRLTAGTARPLEKSRLYRDGAALVLTLTPKYAPLYAEAVARRLEALAAAMALTPRFAVEKS
jgi:exopolyphosphatase/guanosine-5'-triphosphate,3'-diphosphate pyrophosphatase